MSKKVPLPAADPLGRVFIFLTEHDILSLTKGRGVSAALEWHDPQKNAPEPEGLCGAQCQQIESYAEEKKDMTVKELKATIVSEGLNENLLYIHDSRFRPLLKVIRPPYNVILNIVDSGEFEVYGHGEHGYTTFTQKKLSENEACQLVLRLVRSNSEEVSEMHRAIQAINAQKEDRPKQKVVLKPVEDSQAPAAEELQPPHTTSQTEDKVYEPLPAVWDMTLWRSEWGEICLERRPSGYFVHWIVCVPRVIMNKGEIPIPDLSTITVQKFCHIVYNSIPEEDCMYMQGPDLSHIEQIPALMELFKG